MNIEESGRDAIRLAAVLNHYGRIGLPDAQDPSSDVPNPSGKMEGLDAGSYCIVLNSGDLVFYEPEHRTWMWLILEQADVAPSGARSNSSNENGIGSGPIDTRRGAPAGSLVSLKPTADAAGHETALGAWRPSGQSSTASPSGPNLITVANMKQVLSSQNTPAAYEEALFVTEGLLLGAAYGNRVVPYEELVWVVEAATGHSLPLQSMGRFIGDLVERSYPRHMEVLSALEAPAPAPSEPPLESQPASEPGLPSASGTDESATDASVVDLTEVGMSPAPQSVEGRSSEDQIDTSHGVR